jgi:Uma2 family endonuclease
MMSAAPARKLLSEAEYLCLERAATFKSEYFRGEIFPLHGTRRPSYSPGSGEAHSLIAMNFAATLWTQLQCQEYQVFGNDLRLHVENGEFYAYPDITIAGQERRFLDDYRDTLLNPLALIEVLSPGTEAYDRSVKCEQYKRFESLREYVLVAQDQTGVKIYTRDENPNRWRCTVHEEMDAIVEFASVGCRVSLAEIYRDVEFAPLAGVGENDAA